MTDSDVVNTSEPIGGSWGSYKVYKGSTWKFQFYRFISLRRSNNLSTVNNSHYQKITVCGGKILKVIYTFYFLFYSTSYDKWYRD